VLLYGGLAEAAVFMKAEPDQINYLNSKFQETLTLAKRLGEGLERQDQYRAGQIVDRVT